MRNIFTLLFCLSLAAFLSAQQSEQLNSLGLNPKVYYSTKGKPSGDSHKYLSYANNYIVTTDTLKLPFVDDFSTNTLPGYRWVETHVTDTFYNVISGCLSHEGLDTMTGYFINNPSYVYIFNDSTKQTDSVAQAPIAFTNFGNGTQDCFSTTPTTNHYWAPYLSLRFDSSGVVVDSFPVHPGDTVSLTYAPVVYFSQGEKGTLWFDNYAYVNNTYPVNPPTIGVATLDGLNQFGLPYNNTSPTAYGQADYLTSKPIDLSQYQAADSVYLSFFFEPQGLGDAPDKDDSLILEFKDVTGIWQPIWADTGAINTVVDSQKFTQVLELVSFYDAVQNFYPYLYSTFQFRFRNLASLTGNNDHWHIDYVKLDKSRSKNDTAIHDIGFVYPMPTILKNYTEMPGHMFRGVEDLTDSIVLTVHNLADSATVHNPQATDFISSAEELYPTVSVVAAGITQTFNAGATELLLLQPASTYTFSDAFPQDSIVVIAQTTISPNDNRPQNDTVKHVQIMSDILAYDDGSAEEAYGLTGLGIKKFAYQFNLPHPDTLAGFQIMFTQVSTNVKDLVFDFQAWDTIRTNDYSFLDTPIIEIDNKLPLYIDSVNGYATYVLDTPVIIPANFYFGWAQSDERSLQVGYDLNSALGHSHMFTYLNAQWHPTSISPNGSVMLRLILDSDYWGTSSPVNGIKDLTKNDQLNVYPNPTSGNVNISGGRTGSTYELNVTDMTGRLVQHQSAVSNNFTVNSLPNGMYLVSLRDINSGKQYHSKLIKASL